MGDNFMDVCQSLDEGEACDVSALDRFHGLRVAHPPAALKIREGVTVGSNGSSDITIKHAAVSLTIPLELSIMHAGCHSAA